MKTTPPPAVSAHKLARLFKLAQMLLLRAAYYLASAGSVWAPLERAMEDAARPFVLKLTRAVLMLITVQAALRAPQGAPSKADPLRRPRGKWHRALFGARLRRLVRCKDLRARIAALLQMCQDFDAHVARQARRMRKGLARRLANFVRDVGLAPAEVQSPREVLCAADTS